MRVFVWKFTQDSNAQAHAYTLIYKHTCYICFLSPLFVTEEKAVSMKTPTCFKKLISHPHRRSFSNSLPCTQIHTCSLCFSVSVIRDKKEKLSWWKLLLALSENYNSLLQLCSILSTLRHFYSFDIDSIIFDHEHTQTLRREAKIRVNTFLKYTGSTHSTTMTIVPLQRNIKRTDDT